MAFASRTLDRVTGMNSKAGSQARLFFPRFREVSTRLVKEKRIPSDRVLAATRR
jgi:hypothetical protein